MNTFTCFRATIQESDFISTVVTGFDNELFARKSHAVHLTDTRQAA